MVQIRVPALERFRVRFSGEVILPGDDGYETARVVWNGMFDRRPAVIVRPVGVDDVQSAIRYAREQDLLISVRGGGHSMSGLSTCDDGIVIDLSRMRGVTVDPEARMARANGGDARPGLVAGDRWCGRSVDSDDAVHRSAIDQR
jgi:FAD binding domain